MMIIIYKSAPPPPPPLSPVYSASVIKLYLVINHTLKAKGFLFPSKVVDRIICFYTLLALLLHCKTYTCHYDALHHQQQQQERIMFKNFYCSQQTSRRRHPISFLKDFFFFFFTLYVIFPIVEDANSREQMNQNEILYYQADFQARKTCPPSFTKHKSQWW